MYILLDTNKDCDLTWQTHPLNTENAEWVMEGLNAKTYWLTDWLTDHQLQSDSGCECNISQRISLLSTS
jgi:hypothetical protein